MAGDSGGWREILADSKKYWRIAKITKESGKSTTLFSFALKKDFYPTQKNINV
jgi:hypothetical protein